MYTFKIELAGSPNSCITKKNKQKFCALLISGAKVSLFHTRVYSSMKEQLKLKKYAFFQSAKGDPIHLDGCASLKYEIG